jgi:hypothetical protein
VLYLLAFAGILMAGFCMYRGVPLGITADEGLRYSVPNLQPKEATRATPDFVEMKRQADQWGRWAEIALGISVVLCFAGWKRQG